MRASFRSSSYRPGVFGVSERVLEFRVKNASLSAESSASILTESPSAGVQSETTVKQFCRSSGLPVFAIQKRLSAASPLLR